MDLQLFFLSTAFKILVWKASAVLPLTASMTIHLTQLESALFDGIHWFVKLLSAALAYIGDVKKSKVFCKDSLAGPVLVSGQGSKQEGKWERSLLWLSTAPLRHVLDATCPSERDPHLPPWPEQEQLLQSPTPQSNFNFKDSLNSQLLFCS